MKRRASSLSVSVQRSRERRKNLMTATRKTPKTLQQLAGHGLISRRLRGPLHPTNEAKDKMTNMLFAKRADEEITYDDDDAQFGNPAGHSLLGKMDKMEKDFQAFKAATEQKEKDHQAFREATEQKFQMLTPAYESGLKIRQAVLDGFFSDGRDKSFLAERNAVAHGGNILADVHVIKETEEINHDLAERWKRTFSTMYEIDFEFLRQNLAALDRECSELFDIRTNVKLLDMWDAPGRAQAKKDIIQDCNFCLDKWEKWCGAGMLTEMQPKLSGDFNHCLAKAKNAYKQVMFY
ncbi:hypothetical protein FQN50_002911 [Emmonsiellopsis sp. PD_5]|nr:hypothetical protein FQN50_002911 [Emmonsiellopsis sp. PD_5]